MVGSGATVMVGDGGDGGGRTTATDNGKRWPSVVTDSGGEQRRNVAADGD